MNSYASPATSEPPARQARKFPFDIGKVVGRYLQALALLSINSAVIDVLFFDHLHIDLIPILLLVFGHHLAAHHSGARAATIWLLSLIRMIAMVIMISGFVWGTENVSIHLGRKVANPQLWHLLVFFGLVLVLVGTPLGLLCTPQAKLEFAKDRRLSFDRLDTPPDDWIEDDDF